MSTGMKKAVLRDNMRKLKTNGHQQKDIQSQSPPHKKLLKKIEMTYKEPVNKYDLSLQEHVVQTEPKEEVVDFRVEIERRFQKSIANKVYAFPKHGNDDEQEDDSNHSSQNSSYEALKFVTIYDLASQNKRKKAQPYMRPLPEPHSRHVLQESTSNSQNKTKTLNIQTENDWSEQDNQENLPIEVRIRDKSSSAYKKLIHLLEKHLNNPTPSQPTQQVVNQLQTNQQPQNQILHQNNVLTNNFVRREPETVGYNALQKKREPESKSQERADRSHLATQTDLRQSKFVGNTNSQNFKKTLSSEKVSSKIDTTSTTISNLEKSLGNIGTVSTKATTIDVSKLTQENFKKIYSNGMLKSATPQSVNNKNGNFKENIFRTYTQESYPVAAKSKSPLTNLYQKAQNDVMNKKSSPIPSSSTLISGIKPTKQLSNSNLNSMLSTKREETPKDMNRKINFSNFYGSPDPDKATATLMTSLTQQTLSKKNSTKALPTTQQILGTNTAVSPSRKALTNEKHIYMSYDFAAKVVKKPAFKLDLSKRSQGPRQIGRDVLSSTRNRNNKTSGMSEILAESLLRTSYDVQQYSSILNSSTQRNSSKKVGGGFTPNSHTLKNLSFSKIGLMNK